MYHSPHYLKFILRCFFVVVLSLLVSIYINLCVYMWLYTTGNEVMVSMVWCYGDPNPKTSGI